MKHSEEFKFCNLYSSDFDSNKDSILLIDENKAITNILIDDLKDLEKKYNFNMNNYNLIVVAGPNSALNFEQLYKSYKNLNIKYAIIGITSGGEKIVRGKYVKLSGIDVFDLLCRHDKNLKCLFYVQSLNYNIKSIKQKIDRFKRIVGEDLKGYVLQNIYKSTEERQNEILNRLFT